jgi:hypothetical protein
MSGKVSTAAPRTPLASKLADAMNDGRALTAVPLKKMPKAAQTDVRKAGSDFGIETQKFQYGKDTFYVVTKQADDAYTIYDFFSKKGKFAGSQEDDM